MGSVPSLSIGMATALSQDMTAIARERSDPSAAASRSQGSLGAASASPGGNWAAPDLSEVPESARAVLVRLRPGHIGEVAASMGYPGGEVSMQYESGSGFAAAFASVVTCATMLAKGEERPHAVLWEFDWQEAAADLEPADAFATGLLRSAIHLTRGEHLEEAMSKALWREMNRMPHVWVGTSTSEAGPCSKLPGLEMLRQCVRAVATLAAPMNS